METRNMSTAVRSTIRHVSIAIICTCVLLLGTRFLLGHHYSVSVHNLGANPIMVDVAFSEGATQRWALAPGESSCMAAWIDTDGDLSIRVGKHEDGLYVAADMGADLTAEVTDSSVRIHDPTGGIVAWRQCWWP